MMKFPISLQSKIKIVVSILMQIVVFGLPLRSAGQALDVLNAIDAEDTTTLRHLLLDHSSTVNAPLQFDEHWCDSMDVQSHYLINYFPCSTPLYLAATRLKFISAKFLLRNGARAELALMGGSLADSWSSGYDGRTALCQLAYDRSENALKMMKLLIENGADPKKANALNVALNRGNEEAVRYLLGQKDVDVNGVDYYASGALTHVTPLMNACMSNSAKNVWAISILLQRGARVNDVCKRDCSQGSALNMLLYDMKGKTKDQIDSGLKIIRMLLKAGADVNIEDSKGNNSIKLANKYQLYQAQKLLQSSRNVAQEEAQNVAIDPDVIERLASRFKDADQAADIVFHINAALGMEYSRFDPMTLNLAALSGANDDIKKYFQKELQLNPPLNDLQLESLSQSTGLSYDELKAFQVK
jgi:ankyrin repeat protein